MQGERKARKKKLLQRFSKTRARCEAGPIRGDLRLGRDQKNKIKKGLRDVPATTSDVESSEARPGVYGGKQRVGRVSEAVEAQDK